MIKRICDKKGCDKTALGTGVDIEIRVVSPIGNAYKLVAKKDLCGAHVTELSEAVENFLGEKLPAEI